MELEIKKLDRDFARVRRRLERDDARLIKKLEEVVRVEMEEFARKLNKSLETLDKD